MSKTILEQTVRDWVILHEANGIKQHSAEWHAAKVGTIGGSSLATIQGCNPYATVSKLISEKIGLTKFESHIPMQWGNLFEDIIKRYVEHDKQCTVYGEDLYIDGPKYTAYSPDGIAVMDTITDYEFEEITENSTQIVVKSIKKLSIVLCEFKCPYTRIPSGRPPTYYIPQVKMGLDIMKLPQIGLLVEGVFRRCTWEQLGNNAQYDKTLVKTSSGGLPLAYGIVGFYFDKENANGTAKENTLHTTLCNKLWTEYDEFYIEKGDSTNGYQCSDLGEAPPALFTLIMECYDKKILTPWYGTNTYVDKENATNDITEANNDLNTFMAFCSEKNYINFGILPWKLFRIDYNYIGKTDNYLAQWIPKIEEIMELVEKCNSAENTEKKLFIYSNYVNRSMKNGFSDD